MHPPVVAAIFRSWGAAGFCLFVHRYMHPLHVFLLLHALIGLKFET